MGFYLVINKHEICMKMNGSVYYDIKQNGLNSKDRIHVFSLICRFCLVNACVYIDK